MKFKTDRIREEWESGNINKTLVDKINIWLSWLKYRSPDYEPTITDIYRTEQEYKDIYNDTDKKPGIHSYWRAVDIRTNDMPDKLAYDSAQFFNSIPYDFKRPKMKTCIYGDDRHKDHLHIQQVYK